MNTQRIRMSHPRGQTPQNIYSDFEWVRQNEKMLLEQYGECSLIVYQEKVIGVGQTYDEAVLDAERNLAPDITEITPIHAMLHHRHPFLKVRPRPIAENT